LEVGEASTVVSCGCRIGGVDLPQVVFAGNKGPVQVEAWFHSAEVSFKETLGFWKSLFKKFLRKMMFSRIISTVLGA
jgi:hypothetical protein